MLSGIDLINYTFAIVGLTLSFGGLMAVQVSAYMDDWNRLFLKRLFIIINIYLLFDLTSQISLIYLGTKFWRLSKVAVFSESLVSSILMPMLTVYLLHYAKISWKESKTFLSIGAVWFAYLIVLVITQFTSVIYYFTEDNVYHRGPYYPILLIFPITLMLMNLFALYHYRRLLAPQYRKALLVYMMIPAICMLMQAFSYGLLFIVIGTSFSAIYLLIFITKDEAKQNRKNRKENNDQRARILVLQMRPHFIYNTMTSIYYLCDQDPKKAQQVVFDFNNYLRRNFTALEQESVIPFTDELEHTKAYLAVEQVRFDGQLYVEFDIPITDFCLPSLTLQPIVENAVKHGVDPESDPLHILIRTAETEAHYQLIVEDTGPGFDTNDYNRNHYNIDRKGNGIALSNINERLKQNCNGTITFSPRNDGGTIVTIEIKKTSE